MDYVAVARLNGRVEGGVEVNYVAEFNKTALPALAEVGDGLDCPGSQA